MAEDLALAIGYTSIPKAFPESNTVAEQLNLNKLADQLRNQVAMCGWTEVLTFTLCSTEDVSAKMRRPGNELNNVVKISNPKTLEFQVFLSRFNV